MKEKIIREGQMFYGTHADLLNELGFRTKQGLSFNGYQKGTYEIDYDTYVWMAHIDGKVRNMWKNTKKGEMIIEENLDEKVHSIGITHDTRWVFEKFNGYLIFRGVYKLRKGSTNKVRILDKVAREIVL